MVGHHPHRRVIAPHRRAAAEALPQQVRHADQRGAEVDLVQLELRPDGPRGALADHVRARFELPPAGGGDHVARDEIEPDQVGRPFLAAVHPGEQLLRERGRVQVVPVGREQPVAAVGVAVVPGAEQPVQRGVGVAVPEVPAVAVPALDLLQHVVQRAVHAVPHVGLADVEHADEVGAAQHAVGVVPDGGLERSAVRVRVGDHEKEAEGHGAVRHRRDEGRHELQLGLEGAHHRADAVPRRGVPRRRVRPRPVAARRRPVPGPRRPIDPN
ncbi:hypothetical protein DFJ74DRAFT_75878 [Hyaloraphidium curvatum]|nr:hypothetical protein DFJ74DRAFT_75878 [Hyaloraphidium curvatum]